MRAQKEALEQVMSNSDRYLIVILDACRHDEFKQWVAENEGEMLDNVYRVKSAGHETLSWFNNTWTGNYDAVYLSANPFINSITHPTSGKLLAYSKFRKVVDCWRDWSEKFNTCLPETVSGKVRDHLDEDKLIVHYMQPHYPYIVEDLPDDFYRKHPWGNAPGNPPMKVPKNPTREKAEEMNLKEIYRLQVDRVLGCVFDLVEDIDRDAYITADHSELMGEDGKYFHWHPGDERLKVVPWLRVQNE